MTTVIANKVSPNTLLQNAQSLLVSAEISARENGHYGLSSQGEYDFIADKGFKISVGKQLTPSQMTEIENANKPASFNFARDQVARLSLHKHMRAGELTAQSFFADVASDIMGYGELTITEAFARLRRSESPFYPISAEIMKMCERVKAEIDFVIAIPISKPSNANIEKKPEVRMNWKHLHKDKWDNQHWLDYVEDAQQMLNLATKNPTIFAVADWTEILERRKNEMAAK